MFVFFFNGERMSAGTLANYVLQKAREMGVSISNLKLQKILYYVQGYYLAAFGHPLYPEEIHAWHFGPAVPDVYYTFSRYGSDDISSRMDNYAPPMPAIPSDELDLIDRVLMKKLQLTSKELISDSCAEAPWFHATSGGSISRRFIVISIDSIKEYFESKG